MSFAFIFLISCSKNNDCFIADSIEKIKELYVANTVFYLHLRTSGFNEKEYFYELYDKNPKFNNCGKTSTKLISDIHIDTSKGKPIKLIIKDKKLVLLFSNTNTSTTSNIMNFKKIPIEIKNR